VPPSPPPAQPLTAEREFRLKAQAAASTWRRVSRLTSSAKPRPGAISSMPPARDCGPSSAFRRRFGARPAAPWAATRRRSRWPSTRVAGGYLAGMLRKFEKGELRLERTLWALKDQKRGATKRSREGWRSPATPAAIAAGIKREGEVTVPGRLMAVAGRQLRGF
jgi:hypothetical protein